MDKLLISTMLKFVYFDGKDSYILHEGDLAKGTAHYFGVTWDDANTLYLSGTIDTRNIIHRFEVPSMRELSLIPEDRHLLHGTHQIIWIDGVLYCTNAGLNRVEMYDGQNWTYKAWNPSTCDIDHINGIWSDGEYMYVSEHRQNIEVGGSRIRKCEMGSLDLVDIVHMGPNIHNVYMEYGMMHALTSPNSGFHAGMLGAHLVTRLVYRISKPEWGQVLVRGLARTKDYWYIGFSRWEPERSKRNVGDAIVVQLDNDFNELDRLTLLDYGPVCEVRVVGEIDMAHNRIVLEGIG